MGCQNRLYPRGYSWRYVRCHSQQRRIITYTHQVRCVTLRGIYATQPHASFFVLLGSINLSKRERWWILRISNQIILGKRNPLLNSRDDYKPTIICIVYTVYYHCYYLLLFSYWSWREVGGGRGNVVKDTGMAGIPWIIRKAILDHQAFTVNCCTSLSLPLQRFQCGTPRKTSHNNGDTCISRKPTNTFSKSTFPQCFEITNHFPRHHES